MADLPQNTTYNTGGVSTATPPKTPPKPAVKPFSGADPYGNMWGFSDQRDVSGDPYLAYRTPGATATTTDPTRIATPFNPWTAAPTKPSDIQSTRMTLPQGSALKAQAGGTSKDELDHVIALELAGSNNPTNLTIEPGIDTPGGKSFGFDQLENSLAGQVQAGTMSLFQAQLKLATAKAAAGDKGISTGQTTPIPFVGNNQARTPNAAPDPASLIASIPGKPTLGGNDLLAAHVLGTLKPNANTSTLNPLGAYSGSPHQSPYAYVSSTGFKNDYIVPPYLGGASTVANQEALPTAVYTQKAAIQSVPYTLLAHGLITEDKAKSLAMNWRNVSSSGIPTADNMGYIPVKTAQAIVKEWDKAMGGRPLTLGSILESVPEAVDNLGKGVIPEWARQFIVGIAAGATAGGIPLDNAPGATLLDKTSGLLGEAVGMYTGIVALGGLGEMAGAALGGLTTAGRAMGVAADAGVTLSRVSEVTGMPFSRSVGKVVQLGIGDTLGGASILEPASAIANNSVAQAIRNNLAKDFVGSALKNAALFGTYGQMGQTLSDFTQPQKDALQSHISRLGQDLALGGLVGTFPGTWKGAGTVGLGTTMIGLFSGEGLKQSLSQGVAMTALHKVGGFAKDVAGQQEINNQIAIRAQTNGSLEVLHRVLGDQLGLTKVDPRNPNVMTYDPAMLPQWEAAAKARIDEMDRAGELKPADGASDGEAANMKSHVNGAIATLKVMALPPEERDLVANQIMGSFARYAKERTDVNSGSTPNALLPFVDKLAEISPETLHAAPKQNVSEQSGRWEVDWPATADVPKSPKYNGLRTPDNGLRLTGQGANKVNEARIQSYLAGVRNGTASPTVFAVNKKTAAALFRNSNAGITPDMIKEGKYPIDAENYMPVYGTMKDSATGKWVIQWTGTSIPQPERIGVVSRDEAGKRVVSGGKYAYNRDPALTPKEDGGLGMFPEEDHTYNNKTVNLAMKSQGVSVLPMKISAFMNDSIRPTNPYMIVKVGDNEWNLAKQVQEKIGEPATLNTLEENMHDLAAGTNKGNVQPIVNEVAKQLNARGHTASTVISSEKMIGVNEDRQRALHELDIKAQNVLTTSHTREQMKTNFQHSLGITLTPEEAKYALTNRSTLTGGDIKALTEKAIAEGRVEPKTAANYIVRVKPLEKSEAYRTSTIGMIHDTMPLLTPAEAHNAQASRVSLLTGKALLEQEPLIKASPAEVASTPEYQAVLDKLQTTGGGGTYAKQDLQSYAEQGIKVIKDSGLSAKEQSRLGVELQKMINRDDMNQRGVIMGPPEQVGSSLEDEIPSAAAARDKFNQHVQGVKDYIKESTGAGDVPSTKMTPEETIAARMEAVPVMTREQGTNFLQSAKTGIDSLPKDSYGYSFYKTFMGGLDKAFKGSKDPSKNYDLQRFMSWSNSAGKGYWAKQFETIDERTGEPISQPKTRTNKMAQGMHGADLRKESDIRNAELAAEIKPEGTPESIGAAETGGMSENMAASLPDWMKGQTENVPYEQGVKTVSSTQDPRNQYKDLTRMEAQVTPGRIALEGGVDAKGNPLPQITETNAGVEDGKRLVQDMMKEYNKFVNTAHAAGRWANPKMKFIDDKTWSAITTPIKEESNQTKKMSDVVAAAKTYAEGRVSKSKEAIDKLNKQDELLANVGGTRASAEAQKAIAENAKLREKLNALIKKYEGETGATKPDGGGGPGFDINSPAMVFGNLAANQPQMNPTGNNQPQNPIQMGPTTITSTIKSQSSAITPQVQLQEVDTTQAKNALNNARKALANPPTFGTGEMSQTTPAVGTPDPGLRKLKDSIGNLLPSNTWTFNQNTTPNMGIIKTPTGVQNPMISGIDLSRYATHPEHNTIVLNIKRTIPEIKGAQDVQKFIDAYVVKWNKTNKKNGTPPAGLGQMIWDSSQKAGVPVDLMTALAAEESVFGSQGAGAKTNNVGNIMNTGARTRTFKDWATGVQSMANFLAQNQQGRTAPAPITDKSLYKDLAIK